MVEQETRKATITTPTDREIRIEREFDAPREKVFAVMTDPDRISEWWGPRSTSTEVDYMEPVTRGRWRFTVIDSDGRETGFLGAYREVVAPERIVQTFEWEGMPGHVAVETATLEDGMLGSGMEGGMHETYERLDEVLAKTA